MYKHHDQTVERLRALFANDPECRALLLAGSVARGQAQKDSDVDIILVVTDRAFGHRRRQRAYHYYNQDVCGYDHGYVDGKIVNLAFLREVAQRGNETARAAFLGARVIFSKIPGLAGLLRRIVLYPRSGYRKKMENFYTCFEYYYWLAHEARRRRDGWTALQAAVQLVYFGSRLILAWNKRLFPSFKWMIPTLATVPQKPRRLVGLTQAVLARAHPENIEAYYQAVARFRSWPKPAEGWPTRFMLEEEWRWRRQKPPTAEV